MAVKREIKTIFSLDGTEKYKDSIKSINKEQSLLRAETKAMTAQYDLSGDRQKALSAQAEGLAKQIELQKQKIAEAKNAVEQSTKIYGENTNQTKEYKIQVANAETGLAKLQLQLQNTNKEILLNESKLKSAGEQAEKTGTKMQEIGNKVENVGSKMSLAITAPLIAAAGYSAKAAVDFESAFAGVIKTVDATDTQLADLRQGIRDMSKELPASADNIADVAASAGQLGIKTDNILSFSRAMLDLGESTNLSANDAASSLAQFANVTQMSQKDFDKLGSTIVALGNNSATTEADIVSMAMRLAGAGKQVGMTESDIMGISAALSSVGIEAEAGGSAFSKVIVDMQLAVSKGGADLDNFAKVAGMSSSQFAKAYKEDAAGALTAFVTGLGNMQDSGGDAIGTLDAMGITEVRMRDALLRSAGAGDTLKKSIDLSSQAWKDNNALTKEAEQRYGTTESKIKIAKNNIDDAAITIGENFLPVIADMTDWLADAAQAFGAMDPATQKTILAMLGVVAAIGPVTKVVGTLTSTVGGASKAIGTFLKALAEKQAAETAAEAVGGVTKAVGGAGGLSATLSAFAGPAGIAVLAAGVIGALAIAAATAKSDTEALNESIASSAEKAKEFYDGISTAKSALDGFDDSTVWTTENQQKLQQQVDDAQNGITTLTSKAVDQRRALTEKEYERLQQLIEQLGAFADGQIEAFQQKNRIVEAMAKNEQNMTEQRAQELIKGAEETRDEIIKIIDSQYYEQLKKVDETTQRAKELREQGNIEEAAIEESHAKEMMERYSANHQAAVDAENKKTAGVISAVQDRYMQQNQAEIDNLTRIQEIYEQRQRINEEFEAKAEEIRNNETLSVEEKGRSIAWLNKQRMDEEDKLNQELSKLWNDRTAEVSGTMAGMAGTIEFYGGKQSDEAKKASDGIIAAYDNLPKKQREIATNAMQSMIDGLRSKRPDMLNVAFEIFGGFLNKAKEILGIHSPSREMRLIAENLTKTTAETINRTRGKVTDQAAKMADEVLAEARRMGKGAEFGDYVARSRQTVAYAAQVGQRASIALSAPPQISASKPSASGDLVIPVSVNGEFVGEARLTSEQIARQEQIRRRAVGVII